MCIGMVYFGQLRLELHTAIRIPKHCNWRSFWITLWSQTIPGLPCLPFLCVYDIISPGCYCFPTILSDRLWVSSILLPIPTGMQFSPIPDTQEQQQQYHRYNNIISCMHLSCMPVPLYKFNPSIRRSACLSTWPVYCPPPPSPPSHPVTQATKGSLQFISNIFIMWTPFQRGVQKTRRRLANVSSSWSLLTLPAFHHRRRNSSLALPGWCVLFADIMLNSLQPDGATNDEPV